MDEYKNNFDQEKKDLIQGIYNYCDFWCEHCPFTVNCQNFIPELVKDEDTDWIQRNDRNIEYLREKLTQTLEMVLDAMEKDGVDVDEMLNKEKTPEQLQQIEQQEKVKEDVSNHQLLEKASYYSDKLDLWLEKNIDTIQKHREKMEMQLSIGVNTENLLHEALELRDSFENILWYQYFIESKLSRALNGLLSEKEDSENIQNDYNGSAKIALIAINKCLQSWQAISGYFPQNEDEILDMLVLLSQMKTEISALFPNAPKFKRPGFDK